MTTQTMTFDELADKLEKSFLSFEQKLSILALIPQMNDGEKRELLNLIDESVKAEEERKNNERNYQKRLKSLNAEYEKKMNALSHDAAANARNEYEKLSDEKDDSETAVLEKEINAV